jgi:subtilase family serine protease
LRSAFQSAAVVAGLLALAACSSSSGIATPPTAPLGGYTSEQSSAVQGAGAFVLPSNVRRACAESTDPDVARCFALVRTDKVGPDVSGYGPPDLQAAYNLPSSTQGAGQTIGIVDAFDDPNVEADLAVYRSNFGLPECSTANGCFQKVNQLGQTGPYPAPNGGWATEISLDVDMVSAGCPNCHIILVEADDNHFKNLGTAVDRAVTMGANAVSNSYGGPGQHPGRFNAKYYDHPGTIILASAGDGGYTPAIPAAYPTVVAVGGTSLRKVSSGRGWTETVWRGTGSGCAIHQAKPAWQKDAGCKHRLMNDVAAVADPATGVAFYDTYQTHGWGVVGGTSVASPLLGGVYGLAGNTSTLNSAESLYATKASLYDVVTGSDGTCTPAYFCTARVGNDGPTGNGTPNGVSAF